MMSRVERYFGNNVRTADPLFEIVLVSPFATLMLPYTRNSCIIFPSLYSGGCLLLIISLGFLALINIIKWELVDILNDDLLLFINTYKLLG